MITEAEWQDFRKMLGAYQCSDEAEEASRAEMLESFDAGIRSSRENRIHFTASAFVYSTEGFLILEHLKLKKWVQPGGHIDPGENPLEAAVRECVEETGITPKVVAPANMMTPIHLDAHDAGPHHRHLDVRYLMEAEPLVPTPPPEESQKVAWVPFDRLSSVMSGEPTLHALVRISQDL